MVPNGLLETLSACYVGMVPVPLWVDVSAREAGRMKKPEEGGWRPLVARGGFGQGFKVQMGCSCTVL